MSSLPFSSPVAIRSSVVQLRKRPVVDTSPENDILDATRDARRIVKLLQCPLCSYPLVNPVALPCGNDVCRKCLPTDIRVRKHISYPKSRLKGFTCPITSCGVDHVVGDCGTDYALKTITEIAKNAMDEYRISTDANEVLTLVEEQEIWMKAALPAMQNKAISRMLPGGKLSSTYMLAEMGELQYDAEVSYAPMSPTTRASDELDNALLKQLKEAVREELDCQICRNIFLDPFTTTCGHTFCRNCIQSVLENIVNCPACRTPQDLNPTIRSKNPPINYALSMIVSGLCPEAMALRADISLLDEEVKAPALDTPLFVCTLAFPEMPTFLHIFEPRYRLMIDRALQKDRKFGMISHNLSKVPQGNLGPVHFYEYGTLLEIVSIQRYPDGRSVIETKGVSKFKVMKWGMRDGYVIGDVERIDDISIADEEALEVQETSPNSTPKPIPADGIIANTQAEKLTALEADRTELACMPTQDLFEICYKFVQQMERESATWLHSKFYAAYGSPPENPAILPWWLANVLPLSEHEKYRLLETTSVRQRLKICALWTRVIEKQRWNSSSGCTIV